MCIRDRIICQYYDFIRLGKEGYTNIHTQAYEVAKYISDELSKLGPVSYTHLDVYKRQGDSVRGMMSFPYLGMRIS